MSLNNDEMRTVSSAVGKDKVNAAAVVRLYRSRGGSWEYTGRIGAAALCTDTTTNGVFAIKMIDLRTRQLIFEQEVYFGFRYQELAPFFHAFEVDDCTAGLSFADDNEAREFKKGADSFGRQVEAIAKMNQVTATSAPPLIPQKEPKAEKPRKESRRMSTSRGDKEDKGTKKKGFFSKLFGSDTSKAEEDDFVLSGPTGFRHESHIGWDPSNGFDIRNIPPEWKALFKAAGVKKSELQDGATAQFVMNTVADTLLQNNQGGGTPPPVPAHQHSQPPVPNRGAAPPPPPARNDAPPPPPARNDSYHQAPPPPARNDAPPPPPPGGGGPPPPPPHGGGAPPPPPPGGGPPPPPPPAFSGGPPAISSPPVGGGGGARGGLLDEIHKGAKLKKIDPNEVNEMKKGGALVDITGADQGGLAASLAAAMAARRGAIAEEPGGDDSDEWSE